MNTIRFKQVLFNCIKTPLLRHLLLIASGTAVLFPVYAFYYIFPQFSNQLKDYAEDSAIRVADHLRDMIFANSRELTKQSFSREVEIEILKVMKDLRLEQIKIFSKSGEILFSSHPEDVGKKNTHDYFLTHVALGKMYSKVVHKNSKTLEGRIMGAEVVETYVPLMSNKIFAGAIEVYYDISANKTTLTLLLDRLKRMMGAFSLMFLMVFFIILFKSSRNMLGRDVAETLLKTAHSDLEKKVAERTADLKKTNQSLTIEIEKHRISDLAFRESEIRLKAILEANPDPMIMYDLNGHPQYLNPAFTMLFGWSFEELNGEVVPFVPEDQKHLSAEKIKEIYEYGKVLSFETKRLTKNNRMLDILLSGAVTLGMNGKPNGMVVNLTNISDKKAFEAQYKQSQKLESIGTLAGGIAHDFNNILSGIMGYSQLAIMNLKEPDKAKDDLQQIIKGAMRAADLVRQILTFSRQSEFKKQSLKLYLVLGEALKLLRSSIPSTIEIKENIASKAAIIADPTQMHQVIMNLCTNAYQAMHEKGGTLTVELTEIKVPGRNDIPELEMLPGKYLSLEVRDTGCGIPLEIMDRIFDPYFTTKEPDKGTGLGLAVVHGIIKEHSGYLKVYSEPDQGTCFYVFFPVSKEKEVSDNQENMEDVSIVGTERIMFVDDEKTICTSAAGFFEDHGYTIVTFANGEDALKVFENDPHGFDVVITDLTMPVLTGDQLAARVLEIRPDLPVILCSGYSEKLSEEILPARDRYQYLQKPINLEKLAVMIREKLDGKIKNQG